MSLQEFSADTGASRWCTLTRAQPVKRGLAPPTPQGRLDQGSAQIPGGPVGAGKRNYYYYYYPLSPFSKK